VRAHGSPPDPLAAFRGGEGEAGQRVKQGGHGKGDDARERRKRERRKERKGRKEGERVVPYLNPNCVTGHDHNDGRNMAAMAVSP